MTTDATTLAGNSRVPVRRHHHDADAIAHPFTGKPATPDRCTAILPRSARSFPRSHALNELLLARALHVLGVVVW
ncbi:MAG TPA: hypothetical protein PLU65_11940, partial [Dokdonella sp.]|nr:hypothetical protein [Dokdonella sp.]